MTLEEVEKIADVIETCQEVDMDRDAAILMVELFSTASPEFEWNINPTAKPPALLERLRACS